jgi:penicillin-binding protein 2
MISSHRLRLYLLALIILGGFGVLLYRLWGLQINRQDEFVAKLPITDTALQRIPGPRGRIFDRNGVPLADNKANLEIGLNLAEVERVWKEENAKKDKAERSEVPKFVWDPRKEPDTDIVRLLNLTLFPKLDALSLYVQPGDKMIDDIRIWYRENRGVIPYPYQKSLDRTKPEEFRRFAAYAEYANELPGISLRDRSTRIYPMKALGAHVLGYVKVAGRERPPGDEDQHWQFFENDDTGIAGIEKTMDADLRGKPGRRVYLKNELGRLADEIVSERTEPLPGDDIYLTLDARIQTIAEMALREAIYAPGKTGIGRGAVSVIDPNTGEILAMASVPSFDPNIFIPFIRQSDWDALQQKNNPTLPMVTRSLSAFPPGSTFKLVTGIAASMEGDAGRSFNCSGSVNYGGRPFNCWTVQQHVGSHGTLGMAEALKRSCNCYFYQCGNAAGIDRIEQVAKMFGIGSRLGIQLDYAVSDFMPGQQWWATQNKGPWTSAKTANVSIGQGEVQATPLEMALIAGAVAVNGKSYQPTLIHHHVKHSWNKSGEMVELRGEFKPKLKFDLLDLGEHSAKAKDLATIRDGMWKVVNDKSGGTGKRAASPYGIAGKTGTAQKWRIDKETGKKIADNHTWFVAFAPYDHPKIAVCVVIANGKSGGGTAAPVAKRVIERTLGLEDGKFQQPLSPLAPAIGHFDFSEAITYEGDDLPAVEPGEEPTDPGVPETSDEDVTVVKQAVETPAAPDARVGEDLGSAGTASTIKKQQFKQSARP